LFPFPASSFAADPFSAQRLPVAQPKPRVMTGLPHSTMCSLLELNSGASEESSGKGKRLKGLSDLAVCLLVSAKPLPIFICPSESED